MNATGRCLCGAVTYEAQDVNAEITICHCGMCRRWTGGPVFTASVGQVEFQGQEHIQVYDSSAWAERGFCSTCGTNLFYRFKEKGLLSISMGTFDDQSPFRLSAEIFIDEKPEGYHFLGDHPRRTGAQVFAAFQKQSEERAKES